MKTNFLYTVLLSVLFVSCKGKTDPTPAKNPKNDLKVTAQVNAVTSFTTAKFLSLSDVHINGDLTETAFGNVSGTQLWNRTKTKIETIVAQEQPKFMVYLGDLPAYIDSDRAKNSHIMLENLRNLQINIPILYLPGNNDSLKGDYHSFTDGDGNSVLTKDKDMSNPWPILNKDATTVTVSNLNFNKEFGYYAVDLKDGKNTLKVIALNTVIFSNKMETNVVNGTSVTHPMYNSKQNAAHEYVTGDDGISQQQATQDQMHWLENQLKSLAKHDRVLLIMHIPVGIDGYGGKPMWNPSLTYKDLSGIQHALHNGFLSLIETYKSNITGLLNGHTHTDGLRRIYKTTAASGKKNMPNDMISFSISTPGIAVNHYNNPAFKLFTYNTATFDLLDFATYYAAPTNTAQNGDFKYDTNYTYTFSDVYGVQSSNTSIFSTLANETDVEIVQHVNTTLGAMSNQNVKLNFDNAVDVHKN